MTQNLAPTPGSGVAGAGPQGSPGLASVWPTAPVIRPHTVAAITAILVFFAFALIVPLPWWIRNCRVLNHFSPLGTQGQISLVGGYSDAAYQAGGNWQLEPSLEIVRRLQQDPAYRALSPTEQEYQFAQACSRASFDWIKANPARLPALFAMRLYHLWWRDSLPHLLFYLPVLIGALALRRSPLGWTIIALLVANSLIVAVIYSTGGRFLVPLRPLLHILAGVGIWTTLLAAWRWSRPPSALAR